MERYFFHLTSSHDIRDDEGSDHASIDAAKCHAVKLIADVLCKTPEDYWIAELYRVTVSDVKHLILFTVEMMSVDSAAIISRSAAKQRLSTGS
jgi:hypothetical protein